MFPSTPYGGRVVHRLLPYVFLIPLILGGASLLAERVGLLETEFAIATVALGTAAIATAALMVIGHADQVEDVHQRETKFRGLLESAPDAMVVVNKRGRIAFINRQAERLFGYQRDELIGQPVEQLMPMKYRDRHIKYVADFVAAPGTREMGFDRMLLGRHKGGTEIPIEVSLAPVQAGDEILISSAIRDVTERRRAAKELQELSSQNAMLLREMRHRVANSLQLIASILSLKAHSVTSTEARLHLQNAHERVLAVAAVQHHLDDAGHGGLIQIGPYLSDLCGSLVESLVDDGRLIALSVDGGGIETNPVRAVNLGLIVTELVINALKYAFPNEGQQGHVVVSYAESGPDWRLIVSDNGVGQSKPAEGAGRRGGLGMNIVQAVARQLGGEVEIISGPGGMTVMVAGRAHSAPFANNRSQHVPAADIAQEA